MLSITQLRKGTVIEQDNQPYKILEYAQASQGRGGSVVKTKLKNMITGNVLERTFKGNDRVSEANVVHRKVQFLYKDGEHMSCMDTENFETIEVAPDVYDDTPDYLVEGAHVPLVMYGDTPIGVDLPKNVLLRVAHTEQGVKGDTATSAQKPATLETGKEVMVPLFIKSGDAIKVDTRDGKYLERAK